MVRPTQLAQPRGELAVARPLVHVRVPTTQVGERDLEPHVGLDELSDLEQGAAEPPRRILRAVRRLVLRGVHALEHLDRRESLLRRGRQQARRTALVQLLERPRQLVARRFLRHAQAERLEVVDRKSGRGTGQNPRELRPERDGAKRRVGMLLVVAAVAVEPAVGGALHARRTALHVVLRVEVATRRVGRADGVNRGEALVVPQALERREARVQTEVPVQVHDVLRGNGDARPLPVVQRLTVGHDHVEPVHGAALEEANQDWVVRWNDGTMDRGKCGSRQKQRIQAEAKECEAARFHKDAPRDRHCFWNSGPPRANPTASVRACAGSFTSASCSRMTDRV